MMAIGTLIIFIAIILISAIVAGFLIGTTGLLQQRSSLVAKETEERLTAGVEVLNFVAKADVENETINDYTILTRLKAGSDPLNIRYVSLVFTTENYSYPVSLQDNFYSTYGEVEFTDFTNGTNYSFLDLDSDGRDEFAYLDVRNYTVEYSNGSNATFNTTYLVLNFSDYGVYELEIGDLYNLSENNTKSLRFVDEKIELEDAVLGFVQIDSKADINYTIPLITITEFPEECNFDTLVSSNRFCYDVQLGNNNSVVEKGELFNLRFSLPELLSTDDNFELQIVPKTGAIERVKGVVPSVIVLKQIVLYP